MINGIRDWSEEYFKKYCPFTNPASAMSVPLKFVGDQKREFDIFVRISKPEFL